GAITLLADSRGIAAALRTAADLCDEQVPFDDRRAADAEKVLHHAELGPRIALPERFAVEHAHALENSFGAVDVDAVVIHDGEAARAVVVRVIVLVIGRVFEPPDLVSRFTLQTAQTRLVALLVQQ